MVAHSAARLPRHPGPAAWNRLLPAPPAPQQLDRAISADVVVIGAGFAGLSAARRLVQLDATQRIVVLEAGRVADGPAGRNSGFMIDLPHDLSSGNYAGQGLNADIGQTRLNRTAIGFATQAAAELGLDREDFDPAGKINGAATAKGHGHNLDYAAHLKAMGEPCRLLDAADMRALTGTDYYVSGLYTPGTVMIQPAAYIRALAGWLGTKVRLFENSPALSFEADGQHWRVTTPRGEVRAATIILAVNGHAESFGYFRHRLMHVFTYASMSHAMGAEQCRTLGGEAAWALTPADPMGATVRRITGRCGDRIVVRSRFSYDPAMEIGGRRLAAVGAGHDRQFRARFPMLDGLEMEYRWAGLLCLSLNGVPAFGEIERGVYAACCQNGLGTVKGTLSGIAAAELAAGCPSELADTLAGDAPPRRLPPEPLAWLGVNAVMRLNEVRAGREC